MIKKWKLWTMLFVLFLSFSSVESYGDSIDSDKENHYLASLNFFGKLRSNSNKKNVTDTHKREKRNGSSQKNGENQSVFGGKGAGVENCPDAVARGRREYGCTQTSVVNTALLEVSKTVPEETWIENEFSVDLCVKALADVKFIKIIDEIQKGGSFVKSEPPAKVEGNTLVWEFDSMDCGDEMTLRITARADSLGDMIHCVSVIGGLNCCVTTSVGKSDLNIINLGPECYRLNECDEFVVRVSNDGDAIAKNVIVTEFLPDGFEHESGKTEIKFELGDMIPCEVKDVSLPLKAMKRGKFCNQVKAHADNNEAVYSESCIDIILNSVDISKSGTKEQYIYKKADYQITVKNRGDVDLLDSVVSVETDPNVEVIEAPGSSEMGCNSISWCIPVIKVGETQVYTYVGTSNCPGTHENCVSVTSMGDGPCGERVCNDAAASTLWKGHPALHVTTVDNCDPILVDDVTTYTIKVTNQGTAADQNIRIVANFSGELMPLEDSGNRDFTVSGQDVAFAPIDSLDIGECVELKIDVKALKTGDGRVKIQVDSDLLKSPLGVEESTQVY